jgi:hypothetical protein
LIQSCELRQIARLKQSGRLRLELEHPLPRTQSDRERRRFLKLPRFNA